MKKKLVQRTEPNLTADALTVLEHRYLAKDENGQTQETPGQLFERVARAVALAEEKRRGFWAEKYYEMMHSLRFIPNSPTLMNAGKEKGQLSACFVLPVEDSLSSIFDALKSAALIHQSGGGTGFSFSQLRASGSRVKSTYGVASGPVSFMRIFDVATETIKQGGTRRGANMGVLRVDHPEIYDFIESKLDHRTLSNFNISVGITHEFMQALQAKKSFDLKDPQTKKTVKSIPAYELFSKLVESAWKCGDPGLIFLDRINLMNPTPEVGRLESTNPCGEQPLLAYESCNLGSLNLGTYWDWNSQKFDWNAFRKDIHLAIRFLDNVIDVNSYPLVECEKITLRNRKIGLGVMGLADLLLYEGLPYGSEAALKRGEQVMSFLDREAKRASAKLAEERGVFPNWKGSLWQKLKFPKLRNATVSTVAPTGTISMIAGASSGIEPIFSGVFARNVLSGERLVSVHPAVSKLLQSRKLNSFEASDAALSQLLGDVWSPAQKVPVESHVRMQAAFQRHSDSAVSKTINLPEHASLNDIDHAYRLAFELGCKGITVYRDRSKPTQVLEAVEDCVKCEFP
jgi:ribonucleoside-diphosphate reductase alpha chain